MAISPILFPGLIRPLAGIRVCVGAFVGEMRVGVGAFIDKVWVGVAHAVRITTNSAMKVKHKNLFMVILLYT